jgi:hypothetical protein
MPVTNSNKVDLNETLSIPLGHKDSAVSTLKTFDSSFRNINGGLLSLGRNVGLIHGKLELINQVIRNNTVTEGKIDVVQSAMADINKRLSLLEQKLSEETATSIKLMKEIYQIVSQGINVSISDTSEVMPSVTSDVSEVVHSVTSDVSELTSGQMSDSFVNIEEVKHLEEIDINLGHSPSIKPSAVVNSTSELTLDTKTDTNATNNTLEDEVVVDLTSSMVSDKSLVDVPTIVDVPTTVVDMPAVVADQVKSDVVVDLENKVQEVEEVKIQETVAEEIKTKASVDDTLEIEFDEPPKETPKESTEEVIKQDSHMYVQLSEPSNIARKTKPKTTKATKTTRKPKAKK